MTTKQFKFSLFVGGLLVVLGAVITTQASIGISLLGLGAAIALLAVLTRETGRDVESVGLLPIPLEQTRHRMSVDS